LEDDTHFVEMKVGFDPERTGWPCGVVSLSEKQKELRAGNYILFGLADLEKGKYQYR
jgi:hypothetical protein